MKLPISSRLLACAEFIRPGERVADVGTDHGYLTIYLRLHDLASYVYAADIAPQPLNRARENVRKYGITDGVSFHLCDGVRGLPRDFDTLVIAGLGADTMMGILDGGPWLKTGGYRLILQCQSAQNRLRQYLSTHGWVITKEQPVLDGKFIYTVLEAVPGSQPLSPGQHFVTPALLRCGDPLAGEYLDFCRKVVENVASGLEGQTGEKASYYDQARKELLAMEVKP